MKNLLAFFIMFLATMAVHGQTGTVQDYDGNTYNTIKIGDQEWMQENLKTTHYADGTPLVDGTSAGYIYGSTTKYFFWYTESN